MQSSINKSHRPHYQTVESFIKRTVVQELPVHCMVYLWLPPLSNEIWSCPAVIRPPFWYSQFFFLTIGDHHIIGFPLYTYMHGHSMFSYTVLNWRWLITCSFMICVQKERRTLLAKRLDLDASKTKVRKAQSPEKIQQVKTVYLDSKQSLFCSKICLREYLSIWVFELQGRELRRCKYFACICTFSTHVVATRTTSLFEYYRLQIF